MKQLVRPAYLLLAVWVLAAGCATPAHDPVAPHAAVVGEQVSYEAGGTVLNGYMAYVPSARGRQPGILLVHEWWGVTPHMLDYAREFASRGYTALVIDMYGTVADDPKAAGALMNAVMGSPDVMRSRFRAAKKVLAAHPTVDPQRLGAVGFSMGGSIVLQMARAGEDLLGVASVYGPLQTAQPAIKGTTRSRVLVLHADGDPFVNTVSVTPFRREMEAAQVDYRFVDYTGVKHGFANPEATANGKKFGLPIAYDAQADRRARAELYRFFAGVLGR